MYTALCKVREMIHGHEKFLKVTYPVHDLCAWRIMVWEVDSIASIQPRQGVRGDVQHVAPKTDPIHYHR